MPGNNELVHEPVAAKDLGGLSGIRHGSVAGHEFRDRRLNFERMPTISQPRRVLPRELRGVHPGLHARDHERDVLAGAERRTKDRAGARVGDRLFEASDRRARREGRHRDPPLIESLKKAGEPPAPLAQQVGRGHPRINERERMRVARVPPDLVVCGLHREPGRARRHDNRRELFADAAIGARALPRHGGHGDETRDRGARVGDELLAAVNHPVVAVEASSRARRASVGTRLSLGQAKARECAARDEIRQPSLLLGLVTETKQWHCAQAHARLERDRHRLINPGDRLDRKTEREVAPALPAHLLGERKTKQPELAHLPNNR